MHRTPTDEDTDLRNGLDPDAVDALTRELHEMLCRPISGRDPKRDDRHWDADRAKARFLLTGVAGRGWQLTRDVS